MKIELLRVESLCKNIFNERVLDNISFSVFEGECVAILGASGAGKTTLANIIGGITQPDSGRMFVEENRIVLSSLQDAQALGIHIVRYPDNVIRSLSIAENILIHQKSTGIISKKKIYARAVKLLELVGLNKPVNLLAGKLTSVERALVDLASILNIEPHLLILDEPLLPYSTAAQNNLKGIIRALTAKKHSVLYFTPNVKDALAFADRLIILRDGIAAGVYEKSACTERQIIAVMAGKTQYEAKKTRLTREIQEVLEVRHLTSNAYHDINFRLYRGEILGLVGQYESGKSKVLTTLCGLPPRAQGEILLGGKPVNIKNPRVAHRLGIAYFSGVQRHSGLVPTMTVRQNISLRALNKVCRSGMINLKLEDHLAKTFAQSASLPLSLLDVPIGQLPYGVCQRIQLAQCAASSHGKILLLYQPTLRMDLASKKLICEMIYQLAEDGFSIIVASTEIEEMTNLCDRLIVMNGGYAVREFKKSEMDPEYLLALTQSWGEIEHD